MKIIVTVDVSAGSGGLVNITEAIPDGKRRDKVLMDAVYLAAAARAALQPQKPSWLSRIFKQTAATLLLLLLLLLEPFTKETNFMSLEGFERWQKFVVTRTWAPR